MAPTSVKFLDTPITPAKSLIGSALDWIGIHLWNQKAPAPIPIVATAMVTLWRDIYLSYSGPGASGSANEGAMKVDVEFSINKEGVIVSSEKLSRMSYDDEIFFWERKLPCEVTTSLKRFNKLVDEK